jgi:hypothetical protein
MTPKELEELKTEDLTADEHAQVVFFGTGALYKVTNESVIPIIMSSLARSEFEEAIAGTYYRMFAWMESLIELKRPNHIQAVCSGTRTMFELLLDMKQLIDNPTLAKKFHDFTFVARYRNAKLTVEHHDREHGVDVSELVPERNFINDSANSAK